MPGGSLLQAGDADQPRAGQQALGHAVSDPRQQRDLDLGDVRCACTACVALDDLHALYHGIVEQGCGQPCGRRTVKRRVAGQEVDIRHRGLVDAVHVQRCDPAQQFRAAAVHDARLGGCFDAVSVHER